MDCTCDFHEDKRWCFHSWCRCKLVKRDDCDCKKHLLYGWCMHSNCKCLDSEIEEYSSDVLQNWLDNLEDSDSFSE